MEQLELPYFVKLDQFEGPLDLLLQLIKKNEVDIYDIPISTITEQYLEYLEYIKFFNLDVFGDYLNIAAELGYIKSKLLLPNPVLDDDDEGEDPREELVRRLLEYQRYKDAALELSKLEILCNDVFKRGSSYLDEFGNPFEETEILKPDLWSLIEAFREVCKRKDLSFSEDISFKIEHISIEERSEFIIESIKLKGKLEFFSLFDNHRNKAEVIVTFLALLELVKDEQIFIIQDSNYSDLYLTLNGETKIAEQQFA